MKPKHVVIISDCHLSAGIHFNSERNPHEDFYFDDELVEFIEFFSSGKYGDGVEVLFIINGDFLDFLNVATNGDFEEVVTEKLAIHKLETILKGHAKVVQAFREFLKKPGKNLLYNIGNHDADLFFPKVRECLTKALDPQGRAESDVFKINFETPVIDLPGGVQIHHGNQFEAVHVFNYEKPLLTQGLQEPVLNIPWGSFYVLKIVNRFKWEREYVDKVRPVKAMILWGLFFDTWFTLKFAFLSTFYFMKTRFIYSPRRRSRLMVTAKILQQESTTFLQNLEREAREMLNLQPEVQVIIMGHTHMPMHKTYPDGKAYLNTGTWTRMINLDLRGIGNNYKLTFALIDYDQDGKATPTLEQWVGLHKPHRVFFE